MNKTKFLEKYDVPVPRYTSYPTVPYWSESPTTEQWVTALRTALSDEGASWSAYLHLPFCESLCTFCGCNNTITRSHEKESPYVKSILKEWELYKKLVPNFLKRPLKQIHLGGGTPTFFSAMNLKSIVEGVLAGVPIDQDNFEGSIEVDPRRTSVEQLEVLRDLGFNRVSMGVQDFNPEVQRLVNRIQPYEITRDLTQASRDLGYESVNFDLIYGLPKQTVESFKKTTEQTVELRPDRIALYSFALVPWIKPAQRLFKDSDLPVGSEKRDLYEVAHRILSEAGYVEIGMDHFALPTDALYKSHENKTLHRNFMGYTDQKTEVLLGLGVSAISETPTCFHQNEKVLPVYERRAQGGEIPTLRGHVLNPEDQAARDQIMTFMTQMEVELVDEAQAKDVQEFLAPLIEDRLVELDGRRLKVTEDGKPFLRNACVALDQRMRRKKPDTKIFSQAL